MTTIMEHADKVIQPEAKPFNAVDFIKNNLPVVVGAKKIVLHITGNSYRVNWYNPSENLIVKTCWVNLVGEGKDAYLDFPTKQ